ncbi:MULTISPECIES: YqzL family protein [Thermoactinomyces]|uniref:YqzL family protein n=1 Tax=Thermoactinomyces daqus TaxID=1329516 RepID=A0A7W2AHF0_9BACL|nr:MULTISPECIES: YqzL family protein [Thermoactinomyces]MBA4542626.1 YqzL family protein [Thermoactinomyces daqus]MBH8597395.1 YqzL family protein [Thermoactinomyces sp. CICC 10523]MBH8602956.1 YqzL family protein [Thermoactinomyces sp. CICC 10522]MBH8607196.1 YqzL family protein [Thermoactinomyces sp. CICC 10521]
MRNFVWNCFQVTGSIDAYLLFKELQTLEDVAERAEQEEEGEENCC